MQLLYTFTFLNISFKTLLKLCSRQKDGGYHSTDGKKSSSWDLRFLFGGGQRLQVGLRWHHGPQKSSGDCEREGQGAEDMTCRHGSLLNLNYLRPWSKCSRPLTFSRRLPTATLHYALCHVNIHFGSL